MLTTPDRRELLAHLQPVLDPVRLAALRARAQAIHSSGALVDYIQALLTATRRHPEIRVGLSPRAGLALLAAARAAALLDARTHAQPEDVQRVFAAVAAHRLVPAHDTGKDRDVLAREVLAAVPVD
jgi:MoxR-like ATPase